MLEDVVPVSDLKRLCTAQVYHGTTTNPDCMSEATSLVTNTEKFRPTYYLRCERHRGQLPDGNQGVVIDFILPSRTDRIAHDPQPLLRP